MTDWLEGMAGPQFATAVVWTLAALILLVIVLVVAKLVRSMTFGTFVAGGRNRKTRLAVMDAAAVDSHRRLVLVRRDDIEHLLLIGGPTDVVVESEIRTGQGQSRGRQSVFGPEQGSETEFEQQPAMPPLPTAPQPQPARHRAPEPAQLPAIPPRAAAPQPARQPDRQPDRQPERQQQPARSPERAAAPPPRPVRQTNSRPPSREAPPPARSNPPRMPAASMPSTHSMTPVSMSTSLRPPPSRPNNLDDALLRELEVTFDTSTPKAPAKPVEMTLDDEMTKLLGELSNNGR